MVASYINAQQHTSNHVEVYRRNTVILMVAAAWLMSFSSCVVCGFDSHLSSVPRENTIQKLQDNISHAVAAIKITVLHRVYLNMVTARLLINSSLYAIYIATTDRISQRHVQNRRRATFSWPILYFTLSTEFLPHVRHIHLSSKK